MVASQKVCVVFCLTQSSTLFVKFKTEKIFKGETTDLRKRDYITKKEEVIVIFIYLKNEW